MSTDPFASLVAQGQRKLAAEAGPAEAALLPPSASPAHAAIAGAVDELLQLIGGSASNLPGPARMMFATVQSMRGMMLDGLLTMPEANLLGILRNLRDRIDAVPGVVEHA